MTDVDARITGWATRLNIPDAASELAGMLLGVPEAAREQILDAVCSSHESPIRFCADGILKFSSPISRDGKRHISLDVDSLLSLLPEFSSTYNAFAVHPDEILAYTTFQKLLSTLANTMDTPDNFIYDPLVESHLNTVMHGIMISLLIEDYYDPDYEWLGENLERLAPLAVTLYERDDLSREFCEDLIANSAPIAAGTL